jgi:hypothetical protein
MMDAKIRNFSPINGFSLEELVPKDSFYRRGKAPPVMPTVRAARPLPKDPSRPCIGGPPQSRLKSL